MAGRNESGLAKFAHFFTIVTGLVTLGVTGAIAIALQALAGMFLTLSPVESILLGICGFLIALAMALAGLRYIYRRWFSPPPEGEKIYIATREDVEELRVANKQLREELKQVREGAGSVDAKLLIPLISENERVRKGNEEQKVTIDALEKELGQARQSLEEKEADWENQRFGRATVSVTSPEASQDPQEIAQLREQIEQLIAERDTLRERVDRFPASQESRVSDKELKQRCLNLADELAQFLEDYALDEASRAEMNDADLGYDVIRADIETMSQYRKRFKSYVRAMFAELEERGRWEPESFDSEERKRLESPDSPFDVQEIAQHLEAIGYRL